jgi:hypothetical protein
MTADYAPRRPNLAPALLAAAALHLGVFVVLTVFASRPTMVPIGSAVPINIVASAPVTDSRPAEQGIEDQAAAVDTPAPRQPRPIPAPPPNSVISPAPTSARAAASVAPTAARTAPKPPASRPVFDLDALQASINKAARAASARPSMARQGPTRAETALQARAAAGEGVSQSSQQGLQQLLERLWNPNCAVEGTAAISIPVTFQIGGDGRLSGRVSAAGEQASSDPVVAAAARRAIDAVHQAEPYGPEYRGASFKVIFDARKACA